MSSKLGLVALMLSLIVALSGIVSSQEGTISSSGIQNWASTSGTTDVISAAPNPSGYISAPQGNYITESDKNTAENIGRAGTAIGTAADVVISVSTDDACKMGATLGATVAASGTTFSIGTLIVPSAATGLTIAVVSCAPAVLSGIFDPSPGYGNLGDVAKSAYINTHTKTYPEPGKSESYKADPKKALQEWATASWIGSNGGPENVGPTDDGSPSGSSDGSSDGSSIGDFVDITVGGSQTDP